MRYIGNSNKDKLNGEEQLAFLDYLKHSLDNGFSLISSIELMPALWPKRRTNGKISNADERGG